MSDERRRSVSRSGGGGGSPFDPVKLDLGMLILLGIGAVVTIVALEAPHWVEFLGLAAVGFVGGGWLAARSRRIQRRARDESADDEHHGPQ